MTQKAQSSNDTILLVGGGIGGLTASIALAARGFSVHVFERAEHVRAVGSGLTVQINAMKVLQQLQLAEQVCEQGHMAEYGQLRDERGRVLSSMEFAALGKKYGAPVVAIHRARLLRILEARARQWGVNIETSMAFERLEQGPESITAIFANGEQRQGAVLVGCDGLWSRVREALVGPTPLRYAGHTTWRGVAPVSSDSMLCESWGAGHRFGQIPLHKQETYWFAVADAPQGQKDQGSQSDVKAALLARFAGWHGEVTRVLAATPAEVIFRTDCSDRAPIKHWGEGRASLLGDAAHPMMPNLGQGACQAIEDGFVLATSLVLYREQLSSGLRAYEKERIARANWFVDRSWSMGRVAHGVRFTPLRRARDTFMRWAPASAMERTFARMYGEAPTAR